MPPKPYLQVAILLSRVGKRGIEPPMFTTWELIYSQPQHRQSLPLPQNARAPHSISLYATALRIQYQISSASSWSKDLNLALETFRLLVSRSVLLRQIPFLPSTRTAIRRLAIIFFVPCVALSGLQLFTGNSFSWLMHRGIDARTMIWNCNT